MIAREELAERLAQHLTRDGDCLVWQRGVSIRGYGRLKHQGVIYYTNRLAYELEQDLEIGSLPSTTAVLQSCGLHRCCEPQHLYLGTTWLTAREMTERWHPWSRTALVSRRDG